MIFKHVLKPIKLGFSLLAFLILCAIVSLFLTQQRALLETHQKQNAIESGLTQYIWGFDKKSDVVESFHSFWNFKHTSISSNTENPKISLNLSGSVINSNEYETLTIESSKPMKGKLMLEFKTELADEFFYYSSAIELTGKRQDINLRRTWRGKNNYNSQVVKSQWGTAQAKVSSLVLHFSHVGVGFEISSISLPTNAKVQNLSETNIDCHGIIQGKTPLKLNSQLVLSESCLFPSQYMWLLSKVESDHPQSQFIISNSKSYFDSEIHTVNHDYTQIWPLNAVIYLMLVLGLVIALGIRQKYPPRPLEPQEPWYKWLIKKIFLQKLILPHYFVLSYGSILLPTFFLTILMAFLSWPSLSLITEWPKYFLWAVIQQFILGYILAEKVFNDRIDNIFVSSLLAGFVFALFHLPSTTLMLSTFIAGVCWAFGWLLFQRFIPLALSHSILALMFYNTVPEKYLYSAKVLQWFWK